MAICRFARSARTNNELTEHFFVFPLSMLKEIVAVLFLTACSGTLLYSRLNPFVVQLQSISSISSNTSSLIDYINVRFNAHQEFRCWKDNETVTLPVSNFEYLESLSGVCWFSETTDSRVSTWKVCPGDAVYKKSDPKGIAPKLFASSVKTVEYSASGRLESEEFRAGSDSIKVRYECSHTFDGIYDVDMLDTSHIRSITVRSYVFCTDNTNDEFRKLVSNIPVLNVFVDEPGQPAFWEYRFQYPANVVQMHTDVTGKTRNEFYILGSKALANLTDILYTDVDIDGGDPFVSHFLQYALVDGDVCERYNISRAVEISYVCPLEWQDVQNGKATNGWSPYNVTDFPGKTFYARIRQVEEVRFCQYELVIDATSLCLLKQFRQTYKKMDTKNTVRCYPN